MVGRGAFLTCCCFRQHVPDRRTEENRMKWWLWSLGRQRLNVRGGEGAACFSAGPFCSGGRRASDWRAVTRHILSPVSSLSSPSRLNANHLPPQRVRDYPSQPFTAWQISAPHVTQARIGNCTFSFSLWRVSGVLKSNEKHGDALKGGCDMLAENTAALWDDTRHAAPLYAPL